LFILVFGIFGIRSLDGITSSGFRQDPVSDAVPVSGVSYVVHIHGIAIHFKMGILHDAASSCFIFSQQCPVRFLRVLTLQRNLMIFDNFTQLSTAMG